MRGFLPVAWILTVAGGPDQPFAGPLLAAIGIPIYINAEILLPIAAALLDRGLSEGAVMAIVITGLGLSLPELSLLRGFFRMRVIVALVLSSFGVAVASGRSYRWSVASVSEPRGGAGSTTTVGSHQTARAAIRSPDHRTLAPSSTIGHANPSSRRVTFMTHSLAGSDQPVPLRDLCEQHEGEWLLVKILDPAAPAGDAPSLLLAHGPSQAAMFKAERKVRKEDPRACLSIVGGGMKFDGESLRKGLARIAAEEEWVSVSPW